MSGELYIVFIINHRYVRWETFPLTARIKDVFSLLENKYYIKDCIIEVDEKYISKKMKCLLKDICTKTGTSLYVSTTYKYTLSKDVN